MSSSTLADDLLSAAAGLSRWASAQAVIGAPSGQLRLLANVQERGPIRIGDLADFDHTSQPAVTRQVGRLENLGWLQRAADPDDARASLVRITPAGADLLARARRARGQALAQVIAAADVETERVRAAAQLLDQLLNATRSVAEKV